MDFIGSHLTEELIRRDHEVRAFTYYNSFHSSGWLDYAPPEIRNEIKIFQGDIRDPYRVKEAMRGCDMVFHLAALIAIPYSYYSPGSYIDTNVSGTLNILQAVRELEIERMVHTSTIFPAVLIWVWIMTEKRKICVVTGTRAEYGLLCPLMGKIEKDQEFQLQLVVTGMHLSPEFGLTSNEIESDGFQIDHKVEMLLSSDTQVGITKSIGLGVIGYADVFWQLQPDLILLLGDRYEILAAAQSALIAKIPIAHIAGGDTTEGAFDEAIRHSITKMAHLHFVTNEQSWKRVRQLGENPDFIFNTGSLGIDRIKSLIPIGRGELEQRIGFSLLKRNLLITFHPVTLDDKESGLQCKELLYALHNLGPETGVIFTKPNADPGGREIIYLLDKFVSDHPNAIAHTSLGDLCYLSLITQVDAVVGNSSSGIYEVPSFQKPTVNIGDRQKGRLMADSVICCPPERNQIEIAIREAFVKDCHKTINPYGQGDSAEKILNIMKEIPNYRVLLKKHFFRLDVN